MTPLILDTVLRMGLPKTVIPVGETLLDVVALFDMVTVVAPTAVITVLAGMPVPVSGCPIAAWETEVATVRTLLPLVATAPNVALTLLAIAVIVVPAGRPVPRMLAPTRTLAETVPCAMTELLPDVVPIWKVVVSCVL